MAQPEKQLLSLLQKAANPLQNVSLSVKLHGVYAPPEQWKITDEANPNIFTYSVQMFNQELAKGKIQPRKLTQKQKRELEQKNKKGGKKDSKAEEVVGEEVDEAEQQRKRLEWESLSEEQKFHRTQEDPYKAFSLQFEDKELSIELDKEKIADLESKIDQNRVEVILVRKPDMGEEDIAKTKKSKPKSLNVGELYEAKYKGTIDMSEFQNPGSTATSQRIKVKFNQEMPEDGVKIDAENCYVFIEICFSEPLNPIVEQIKPPVNQILPNFNVPQKKDSPSSIQKLKLEVCRSIKAISQEYLQHFSKEKQHGAQDRKNVNLSAISTLRLNEINRKKQVFLTEFINSGKFNILRQRVGKSIRAVIIDKFRKEKGAGKIDMEDINVTLSELNVFFQEQLTKTIDEFMGMENTTVHEDIVLGYENSKHSRKQTISPIVSQTENQREFRLASEHEIIHLLDKAEENYLNILLANEGSIEAKESYAYFCLKSKRFDEAYLLFSQIAQQNSNPLYRLIQSTLLISMKQYRQALSILTGLMEQPEREIAQKILYNQLLAFMYEIQGNIKESQKYLAIAQRYYQMKQNPNLKFEVTPNPYKQARPKTPKPQRYQSQLTHKQSQEIRSSLINHLASLNLYDLVRSFLDKMEQSFKKSILEIQVCIFEDNYNEAIDKIDTLLKKSDNIRNIDLLLIKADACYRDDRMFESEEVYLNILQLKPPQNKSLQIYLKLGYTYIHRKSWEDAKIVFQKACQLKYNCSVAWLGLGIANLNLERYQQAQQALNLTKIYNPLSSESEAYQVKVNQHFSKIYGGEIAS